MHDAAGLPADAVYEKVELPWGRVVARAPLPHRTLVDELGPELVWDELRVGPVMLQYCRSLPGVFALEAPALTSSPDHVWQEDDLVVDARARSGHLIAPHAAGVTAFLLDGPTVHVAHRPHGQWGVPRPPWEAWWDERMPAYLRARTARDGMGESLWRAVAVARLLRLWRPPLQEALVRDAHAPLRRWWQALPPRVVGAVEEAGAAHTALVPASGPVRLADLLLRDDLECLRTLLTIGERACPLLDEALCDADRRPPVRESAWLDPQLQDALGRSVDIWWAQP